jgi:hypothetical protein
MEWFRKYIYDAMPCKDPCSRMNLMLDTAGLLYLIGFVNIGGSILLGVFKLAALHKSARIHGYTVLLAPLKSLPCLLIKF